MAARPDTEAMRRQLAECSESVGNMIAEAAHSPTPERLELLAIQLQGVARLASVYRSALIAEARNGDDS
jgi:hypothetical protein